MAPMLFNLYTEMIMREAELVGEEEGLRIGGNIVNNICYTDDTTLAAESEEGIAANSWQDNNSKWEILTASEFKEDKDYVQHGDENF